MVAEEHVVEAPDGRRLHVLERGAAGGLAVNDRLLTTP